MVLTALENTYAKPMKEVTPFQHWFNKNLINLEIEFGLKAKQEERNKKIEDFKLFPGQQSSLKDKFMKWCEEKYNEKRK